MNEGLKALARALATILVAPQLLSYSIRSAVLGKNRAFEGSVQALALVPGLPGQYLRRAFLSHVIEYCAPTAVIGFGTLMSQTGCRIEDRVYIGPHCHLGLVHLERDVLLAAGVQIPSGPHTHGTDPAEAIRNQGGRPRLVRIGAGTWIGSSAVVLADVGRDTIVGAGAVVTRPLPDRVIAAGIPARVVRQRDEAGSASA
jgi:acetyltransferase-like isoleucine patch superfamily enzyme